MLKADTETLLLEKPKQCYTRHSNPRNSLNKNSATIKDKIKLSDLSEDCEAMHHMFIKNKKTKKQKKEQLENALYF